MTEPTLQLLGRTRVRTEEGWHHVGADRPHLLLIYLAYQREWVSREQLADLFWRDSVSSAARRNLRKVLFRLRAFDWLDGVEEEAPGLRWRVRTDVEAFRVAVAAGRWQEAIDLYGGPLLDGFDIRGSPAFAEWLELERVRLGQRYQEARAHYARELEVAGDLDGALALVRDTLERDPLDEDAHRSVIRLEHRRGNPDAAFEQFERLRNTLAEELGVEPLAETLTLLAELEEGGAAQARHALVIGRPDDVPERPERLLGRASALAEAAAALEAGGRLLVHGFGGVGKTAFAATAAAAHLERGGGRAVWLQVGSEGPDGVFDALARAFEGQQELARSPDPTDALRGMLRASRLSLVVLDDVWNAYALSKVADALPAGLPLLVTSRQRYPRLQRITLDRLERVDALELLGLHAERELADDAGADALCDLLGDHPFALRIAGSVLREDALEAVELFERIERSPHDLATPAELEDEGRRSVSSLLSVSLEPLGDLEYEAFLSYGALPTPGVTPALLARCLRRDAEAVEDALFGLVQRGLAERVARPASDAVSYRIHDLAHSFARANRFQRPVTVIRAALAYLDEHRVDLEGLDLEIDNLLGTARAARELGRDEELVAFMAGLTVEGSYFSARGHGPGSLGLLEAAAAAAERLGDTRGARDLNGKLGDAFINLLGDVERASERYRAALELARRAGDRGREAVFLGNLGVTLYLQGEEGDNEALTEAYALARASGDDHSLNLVINHLAHVAGLKGDMQGANRLLRESLEVVARLEQSGRLSRDEVARNRALSLLNLGETAYRLGRFDEGLRLRLEALRVATESGNQLWMANAHAEIGEMHHEAGARAEAEAHLRAALELFRANHVTRDVEKLSRLLREEGYERAAAPPASG